MTNELLATIELQKQEIERLKSIISSTKEDFLNANSKNIELEDKLQQRVNIIKEVREYITTIKDEDIQYTIGWVKQDILQILDKVDENI